MNDLVDKIYDAAVVYEQVIDNLTNDITVGRFDNKRFKTDYARFIYTCEGIRNHDDRRVRRLYLIMKSIINDAREVVARPTARNRKKFKKTGEIRTEQFRAIIQEIIEARK
ncbi:Uncharacterised protein [Chlamydia abortus]|nr:Uncharacterised protein [Chlamydia abortus]